MMDPSPHRSRVPSQGRSVDAEPMTASAWPAVRAPCTPCSSVYLFWNSCTRTLAQLHRSSLTKARRYASMRRVVLDGELAVP